MRMAWNASASTMLKQRSRALRLFSTQKRWSRRNLACKGLSARRPRGVMGNKVKRLHALMRRTSTASGLHGLPQAAKWLGEKLQTPRPSGHPRRGGASRRASPTAGAIAQGLIKAVVSACSPQRLRKVQVLRRLSLLPYRPHINGCKDIIRCLVLGPPINGLLLYYSPRSVSFA
jgi:hypothetical protein